MDLVIDESMLLNHDYDLRLNLNPETPGACFPNLVIGGFIQLDSEYDLVQYLDMKTPVAHLLNLTICDSIH